MKLDGRFCHHNTFISFVRDPPENGHGTTSFSENYFERRVAANSVVTNAAVVTTEGDDFHLLERVEINGKKLKELQKSHHMLRCDFAFPHNDADRRQPKSKDSQPNQSRNEEDPIHWPISVCQILAMLFCDINGCQVLRDTKVERLLKLYHIVVEDCDNELSVDEL